MTSIPVFYSFARSGGTLINKCLGCHPDNLILSEVNPAGAYKPIEAQALEWLQLIGESERQDFAALGYGDQIAFLDGRARERGKSLIVRDWCSINFLPPGLGRDLVPPCSGVLEQPVYLRAHGFEPRAVVVTREAGSVYLSIKRAFRTMAALDLDTFARTYLAYAESVQRLPVFKLEDFRAGPEEELRRLTLDLGVAYPPNFMTEFAAFDRCTGNNTLTEKAASELATTILGGEGSPRNEEWERVSRHPLCQQANQLFGYHGTV